MKRKMKFLRWYLAAIALSTVGGCVTSTQIQDFASTEIARVISDSFGQILFTFLQATSPTAAL